MFVAAQVIGACSWRSAGQTWDTAAFENRNQLRGIAPPAWCDDERERPPAGLSGQMDDDFSNARLVPRSSARAAPAEPTPQPTDHPAPHRPERRQREQVTRPIGQCLGVKPVERPLLPRPRGHSEDLTLADEAAPVVAKLGARNTSTKSVPAGKFTADGRRRLANLGLEWAAS